MTRRPPSRGRPRPEAPQAGQRPLRVGEQVRHALADALRTAHFPEPEMEALATVTVTEVRMSPDLRHARAYVMPLGGAARAETLELLTRATPILRRMIGQEVRLRFVPELKFALDTTFDAAARIDAALREALAAQATIGDVTRLDDDDESGGAPQRGATDPAEGDER